jgi:hypothetical protein
MVAYRKKGLCHLQHVQLDVPALLFVWLQHFNVEEIQDKL